MENKMATDTSRNVCACCDNQKLVGGKLCLWCQKDKRKVALFTLFSSFCRYYKPHLRFCRECMKVIATPDDIKEWICNSWDTGSYVNPYNGLDYDDYDNGRDDFVKHYHDYTYSAIRCNLCECAEWSEGHWEDEHYYRNTLNLADVQKIESIKTKRLEKEMMKELAKDLANE